MTYDIPQSTKPLQPGSMCTEQLYQEGVALIQGATLYDCGIIKSADVVDVIDAVTKVLAYWRAKLTAYPLPPESAPAPEPAPAPTPEPAPTPAPELTPVQPIVKRVIIRSRYRDLNAKCRGTECYRMYLDLATSRGDWLDKHPEAITTHRGWCARGIRASERRCCDKVEVPTGTLVLDIDKGVGGGNTTYQVGYVIAKEESNEGAIEWEGGNGYPLVRHCGTQGIGIHIVEIDGVRHTFHTAS